MSAIETASSAACTILKVTLVIAICLLVGFCIGVGAGVRLHSRDTDPAPGCMIAHAPAKTRDGIWILVPIEICGAKKERIV